MTGISAQGSVLIHSAPASLQPHVEWAIGRLLGGPAGLTWTAQPALSGTFRTELAFDSSVSFGAVLASELLGWGALRFEIIQHESFGVAGWRWAYTPSLGLFQGQIDALGNTLVTEHRLNSILDESNGAGADLKAQLRLAMGHPWDLELERYREAGELAPVVYLRAN
jgi:hypothetical protein